MKDIFELIILINLFPNMKLKLSKIFASITPKSIGVSKKSYKRFKRLDESIIISRICLKIIGTITGGITLNLIVPGVLNGAGILVTNFEKNEELQEKDRNDKNRFYNT